MLYVWFIHGGLNNNSNGIRITSLSNKDMWVGTKSVFFPRWSFAFSHRKFISFFI